MTVGAMDIGRLAAEIMEGRVKAVEWCEREGVSLEAMCLIFECAERNFAEMLAEGDDPSDALTDIMGQVFRLGWEASREYRL